jgi:hypothetical protein
MKSYLLASAILWGFKEMISVNFNWPYTRYQRIEEPYRYDKFFVDDLFSIFDRLGDCLVYTMHTTKLLRTGYAS